MQAYSSALAINGGRFHFLTNSSSVFITVGAYTPQPSGRTRSCGSLDHFRIRRRPAIVFITVLSCYNNICINVFIKRIICKYILYMQITVISYTHAAVPRFRID